jgi:hypothetical protein
LIFFFWYTFLKIWRVKMVCCYASSFMFCSTCLPILLHFYVKLIWNGVFKRILTAIVVLRYSRNFKTLLNV